MPQIETDAFRTEYEEIFYNHICNYHEFSNVTHNVQVLNYEVDFLVYVDDLYIVIEIDGKHHKDNYNHRMHDKKKNKELCAAGYAVVRVANKNVRNLARLKRIVHKLRVKIKKHKIKEGDCIFYYD